MTALRSPVAEVLANILDRALGSAVLSDEASTGAKFRVLSYREDFEYLWGTGRHAQGGPLNGADESRILVIIWDGMPDAADTINVADRVTCFDWIVAYVLSQGRSGTAPRCHVFVLDLVSQRHPGAFACSMLPALLRFLPWVRVYRPVAKNEDVVEDALRVLGGVPHGEISCGAESATETMTDREVPLDDARFDGSVDNPTQDLDDLERADGAHDAKRSRGAAELLDSMLGPEELGALRLLADLGLGEGRIAGRLPEMQTGPLGGSTRHLIRSLWVNEITRTEGNHEVSNLVGPFVLAEGLVAGGWPGAKDVRKRLQRDPLRLALKVLLQALELLPPDSDDDDAPRTNKQAISAPPEPRSPLRHELVERDLFSRFDPGVHFLLVDDQAPLGYQDVVACVLFGENTPTRIEQLDIWTQRGKHMFHSTTTAEILVQWLFESTGLNIAPRSVEAACPRCGGKGPASAVDWGRPRLLGRRITDAGGSPAPEEFDILLLDLRLFDRSSASREQGERHHFQKLLDFYHQSGLCDSMRSDLDPLKRSAQAVQKHLAALSGLKCAGRAPNPEHLAFLPLLVARVDPSLPIVLFASTRQRFIVEALRDCPSITTAFAKPVITLYEQGLAPQQSVEQLYSSLVGALDFHERRAVWLDLVKRQRAIDSEGSIIVSLPCLQNKPFDEKVAVPLSYSVSANDLQRLAAEYKHTVLRGQFADALLGPENWLEGMRVDVQRLQSFPASRVIADVLSDELPSDKTVDAEHISGTLEKVIRRGGVCKETIREISKEQLESKIGASALGPLLKQLDQPLLTRPDDLVALGVSGLIQRKPSAILAKLLEVHGDWFGMLHQFKSSAPEWGEILKEDARDAGYAVIDAFRNARAHYRIRPDDSEKIRDFSIWLWLWALAAAIPIGSSPVEAGKGPYEALLDWGRPLLTTQSDGASVNACASILRKIKSTQDHGWLQVRDQRIRKLIDKTDTPKISSRKMDALPATPPPAPISTPWLPSSDTILLKCTAGAGRLTDDTATRLRDVVGAREAVRLKEKRRTIFEVSFQTEDEAKRLADKIQSTYWLFVDGAAFEVKKTPAGARPTAAEARGKVITQQSFTPKTPRGFSRSQWFESQRSKGTTRKKNDKRR